MQSKPAETAAIYFTSIIFNRFERDNQVKNVILQNASNRFCAFFRKIRPKNHYRF